MTTFGESHGPAIGLVVDGVPPQIAVDLEAMAADLRRRRPGQSAVSSPRQETDEVEPLSGIFQGVTTGAPIALLIRNRDARSEDYRELAQSFRPGHADFGYWARYGLRDHRGGGRASGRETAARVAAGSLAKQTLAHLGHTVNIIGHVLRIGDITATTFDPATIAQNTVRCADPRAAGAMVAAIAAAKADGDSLGGVVEVRASGVPRGLGQPLYGKLDAQLAGALMGIGAVKGVELGDGFALASMRGSQANDELEPGAFASNHAGGVIGGISTGAEIVTRLAVKPTASIARPQRSIDDKGRPVTVTTNGRHDPCIAPRLVPVAEAMVALVLADAALAPPYPRDRTGTDVMETEG